MSDLVKELRNGDLLHMSAADRIDALESALCEISRAGGDLPADVLLRACVAVARAALKQD